MMLWSSTIMVCSFSVWLWSIEIWIKLKFFCETLIFDFLQCSLKLLSSLIFLQSVGAKLKKYRLSGHWLSNDIQYPVKIAIRYIPNKNLLLHLLPFDFQLTLVMTNYLFNKQSQWLYTSRVSKPKQSQWLCTSRVSKPKLVKGTNILNIICYNFHQVINSTTNSWWIYPVTYLCHCTLLSV